MKKALKEIVEMGWEFVKDMYEVLGIIGTAAVAGLFTLMILGAEYGNGQPVTWDKSILIYLGMVSFLVFYIFLKGCMFESLSQIQEACERRKAA